MGPIGPMGPMTPWGGGLFCGGWEVEIAAIEGHHVGDFGDGVFLEYGSGPLEGELRLAEALENGDVVALEDDERTARSRASERGPFHILRGADLRKRQPIGELQPAPAGVEADGEFSGAGAVAIKGIGDEKDADFCFGDEGFAVREFAGETGLDDLCCG